jgi:hypothetical protein
MNKIDRNYQFTGLLFGYNTMADENFLKKYCHLLTRSYSLYIEQAELNTRRALPVLYFI